jgi:hypothetical protein
LLLMTTLSVPSVTTATSKVLRYSTQKTAGYPSAPADMEARKRVVAGKVTPLHGDGSDLACLLATADGLPRQTGIATAMVPPCLSGNGRIDTRGARAPPLSFA